MNPCGAVIVCWSIWRSFAVLTPVEIEAVRLSRDSLAKLAKQYGVSKSTIANIKARRTHKDPGVCPTCRRSYEDRDLPPVV